MPSSARAALDIRHQRQPCGRVSGMRHGGANRVYGMLNGVEGLLNERVADLTATLGFA